MNRNDKKYSQFFLCNEMLDTADVVASFDPSVTDSIAAKVAAAGKLMMTGEGSSRIFPAKNAIRKAMSWGVDLMVATDGSRQVAEYDLSKFAAMLASNSGRTQEVVRLAKMMDDIGNSNRFGLTSNADTVLEENCTESIVLNCGWEKAVAATKSVAEQALVYQAIVSKIAGRDMAAGLKAAGESITAALEVEIDAAIVEKAVKAPTIYFAGYNDGVAEELTLKTNEITRKKSDFLEGTYAVHGIEEVMTGDDIVFVIEPFESELEKFKTVLVDGVGLTVVAVATKQAGDFPTVIVPDAGDFNPYVFLAAGWNLLVEIGLALGINLDKAERARKIGNEFTG